MNAEIALVLIIPVLTAVLSRITPVKRTSSTICIIGQIIGFVITVRLCLPIFLDGAVLQEGLWYIDGLSALFMMITVLVALMASMYSKGYIEFERKEGTNTTISERNYYLSFSLFVAVMLCTFMVSSLGVMWIIIEATTLVSSFLVGFYRSEHSIEAAWKYLIICSVGITLALMGISLVYASVSGVIPNDINSLNWPVLMSVASKLDPALLKTAMVFIIVGFGTKVGFAPMHTWLPDAHSQAPIPISALLSATLLNCALFCIIRFYTISEITIPGFAQTLLLIFGFASVIIAAAFIIISKDIKRMLAYSSIEHMGIIAIGFGLGTWTSIFAALFLILAHSITKPILFFAAGNIIQQYGTKNMSSIKGLRKEMPFTSSMLMIGTLAILGMPVFSVFIGELTMLYSMLDAGMWWMIVLFVTLMIIIFAGFVMHIFPMFSGNTERDIHESNDLIRAAPLVILTGFTIFFGLLMPENILDGFRFIIDNIFGGAL